MRHLPQNWTTCLLEDVVEVLDSFRIPLNSSERERRISGKAPDELYPYYGATGIAGYVDDYLFEEPLILLGEDGIPFHDPVSNKAYIVSGKYWVNNHAHVLKPHRELIDIRYICAYLNYFDYEGVISGSTRLKLTQTAMRKIPVPLAPTAEQERIADKLDTLLAQVDTCQERLDRVQHLLVRFRQSILADATSGSLTQDWRLENSTYQLGLKNFEFEDADCLGNFLFPSSWEIHRLSDIAEITSGITKSSKLQDPSFEEIPYLRVANVQRGYFDLTDVKTIRAPQNHIEGRLLESGDILFNEGGDLDKLGRGWVWSGEIERCIFQNHVFRARLHDSEFSPHFFSHYGNSRGVEYFITYGKQTTNLASINKTVLSNLPVVVPPIEEQHEIVRRIEVLFAFADRVETRLQRARTQLKHMIPTLLDKAFKGDLVPQDPNDEPAPILLKRIRESQANAPEQYAKPRRRVEMADKKPRRSKKSELISIVQALREAGRELSAGDLFTEAGYPNDADSEQIEMFFVAVRDAILSNEITKTRRHDTDWFALTSETVANEN